MSFTHSSSSSFKKPEKNPSPSQTATKKNIKDPERKSNQQTPSGFTAQGILQYVKEKIKPKKNAFKKWATIRKTLKTKNQTNVIEALKKAEDEFLKIDPEKAPSTLKKIKAQHPTILNKEKEAEEAEKAKRRIISRNIKIQQAIQEGKPLTLPPLKRRPILTANQKQTLKNKGIVGLKKGGTRRRR